MVSEKSASAHACEMSSELWWNMSPTSNCVDTQYMLSSFSRLHSCWKFTRDDWLGLNKFVLFFSLGRLDVLPFYAQFSLILFCPAKRLGLANDSCVWWVPKMWCSSDVELIRRLFGIKKWHTVWTIRHVLRGGFRSQIVPKSSSI
jgi:hypothetical protein